MQSDEKKIIQSFFVPGLFLVFMWLVMISEIIFHFDASFLGIHPLHLDGLPGILFSPLIHGDWQHIAANSAPVLILGGALYFFYRSIATKVFILIILLTGVWVWIGARGSYHIGASGLIYGLSSFLLVSGFIRRENGLMALSLIVVFLYGSFVWGIFPEFFPEKNISWESHLSGLIAGLVLAVFYRKEGPQRQNHHWDDEEETEEECIDESENENEKPYWDVPEPDRNDLTVVYHFKKQSKNQ